MDEDTDSTPIMRFAAYAGTSMVLASGVLVQALHKRANFYSICVYLAQSNACLMILTNLALLTLCTAMLCLQRLSYGPLRPIEIEQLYEKAWFAITETCLAMTIFRDEVGGWFLVMFVCLLIGKVWGWIGEGRVEILEQQPPVDPRLFHARLSTSLAISSIFDIFLLRYSVQTVLLQARPNMMVMFAFEFAVLSVASLSTAARYLISLHESAVIRNQIHSRRAQIIQDRQENSHGSGVSIQPNIIPNGNVGLEVDPMDIDVPGWEDKGRWIFYLDLATDFLKLILYLTFFSVLCMFYGMPIHIIRDVAMTIRSFYKRINDFVRYRQATRDMNARYPDATADDISGEDVCIICRESMRPWQQLGSGQTDANNPSMPSPWEERLRPKRLPCGHVLHFACLRSWLERQQNCPTCRAPVLGSRTNVSDPTPLNQPAIQQGQVQQLQEARQDVQQPIIRQNVFNFGPFRLAIGRQGLGQPANGYPPDPQGSAPAGGDVRGASGPFRQAPTSSQRVVANLSPTSVQLQLYHLEQQLTQEIDDLHVQADQLFLVRVLQGELARLRAMRSSPGTFPVSLNPSILHPSFLPSLNGALTFPRAPINGFAQHRLDGGNQTLPDGLTVPDGWNVLPLGRISNDLGTIPTTVSTPASDINLRRGIYDLISQSSLEPSLESEVLNSQNDSFGMTASTSQENEPAVGQPASNVLADSNRLGIGPSYTHDTSNSPSHDHNPARKLPSIAPSLSLESSDANLIIDREQLIPSDTDISVLQSSSGTELEACSALRQGGVGSSQAKGKGKAVTVEDDIDDVDVD